jgi:competence protein ComEA
VVGGAIVMGVAVVTLGPVGVILAGAAVGALSGGLNTAIDGGDWGDIGRSALIGGVFGAAAGGLAHIIPASTAATLGQRALTNVGLSASQEFPLAAGQEAADSYLWGGDRQMDWDKALLDGTMGTVGGTVSGELEFQLDMGPTIDDGLQGAMNGETAASLLPNPVRHDWAIGTASRADLESVQGIGPVLANRILEARSANGGVLTAAQMDAIEGIGPARLEALKAAGAF